jgi:ParB-like chromosome segregation protein Spo0J
VLAEYGWRQPIVVDAKGVIVVGHTRLLAAKRLDLPQVPVHVASDLTPQQIKAYRLADNRTAEESSWDLELLPLEISELADLGYDLQVLGFNPNELAKLGYIGTEGLTDPDETPEAPAPYLQPLNSLGRLEYTQTMQSPAGLSLSLRFVDHLR